MSNYTYSPQLEEVIQYHLNELVDYRRNLNPAFHQARIEKTDKDIEYVRGELTKIQSLAPSFIHQEELEFTQEIN